MLAFQHFILTPFFVKRTLGGTTRPLPDLDWLLGRIRLFERHCFPSVASQTSQNFRWLLFFDPETPDQALAEVRRIIEGRPNILICFLPVWNKADFVATIREIAGDDLQWLVSTRLDNDDGWHEQFVELLQREVRPGVREFLNFTQGYIVAGDRTYLYRHPSNAFISMSEPPDAIETPFSIGHERLAELAPIRQIDAPPAFFQMVHGGNVSNKIRGVRVVADQACAAFGNLRFALIDASPDAPWSVKLENATFGPVRTARDGLFRIAKQIRGRSGAVAGLKNAN